jgi:rare lipoprotein A
MLARNWRPLLALILLALAGASLFIGMLVWTIPAMAGETCAGQIVTASYYGKETCVPGKRCQTADGTRFDGSQLLVAHRTLPFGTMVRFTYQGRSVTVPVRDRGPWIAGREYDLSWAAAAKLGFINSGVVELCAQRLK